ncbi:MAG: type VI secretion system lipoprotein TssJ [Planctomycetes bacterium]|nr:type VI secretion system lipoprotein TssJ [Planctomycetota bacterium]
MSSLRHRAPRARRTVVALLLASFAAAGCASGPYDASLQFAGSSQLNPTSFGEPGAVTLRLFALKDAEAFRNASDDDLMAEKPQLAPTAWIEPHKEVTVYVDQVVDVKFEIKPEVRFVGVLGLFNKMTEKSRLVMSVDELDDHPKLQLDKFAITLLGDDDPEKGDTEKGDAKPADGQPGKGEKKDGKKTP